MYGHHDDAMVNENEIRDDDCACALNVREISDGRIDSIEGVSADVEDEIVEGESLHS